MRIKKVTTYALEYELPENEQFAFSQSWTRMRTCLICKIDTDDGLTGWGEAFGPAQIHKTIIDRYYAPFLINKDPFDSQVIWENLYNMFRDNGQKGVTIEALSAVDIALWDLKGKSIGRPVYQMMGGSVRDKIEPYATGMYRRYTKEEISECVSEASSYVKKGFRAIKIKIGFGVKYDVRIVEAIREKIGKNIAIMVDANHAYNSTDAIRVGKALEPYDISWFEEPVPPEDLDGYKNVREKLSIPISGGEAEFTRYGMQHLITRRCVDIVQPDCTVTGGLSEFSKIVTLCTIANVRCIPHVWGSGIALMTGIHAAFSLPDFPPALEPATTFVEYDQTPNIFREKIALGIPEIKDGWIEAPQKPGLGIEIDQKLIQEYTVK
jgi:D-galactarolactone cycloisomerase